MNAESRRAVAAAEQIARLLRNTEGLVRRVGGEWLAAALANAKGAEVRVTGGTPLRLPQPVVASATAVAIQRIWDRSRIVYAIHPLMVKALTDSTSGLLPGELFDRLPHTDPLVVLPEPVHFPTPDGKDGRVLGFYVCGRTPELGLCSTHAPNRDALGLMFVTQVHDPASGRHVDTDYTRVRLPINARRFTLAQAVNDTLQAYAPDPQLALTPAEHSDWVRNLIAVALNILLYLCTDDADTQSSPVKPPARRKESRNTKSQKRPSRLIKVGWRLGPAIDHTRRARASRPPSTLTGRSQLPHQRRAHFQTFWAGPGQHQPIVKFIKPYWVRLDLLDPHHPPPEHQVIPVRPPR